MSKKNRDGQTDTPASGSAGGSRWSDYFWANLFFFAFLFVLVYVVRASCISPGDEQIPAIQYVLDGTFRFLVLLLGGGFLLVTLFDAAYEFFAGKAEETVPPDETPRA